MISFNLKIVERNRNEYRFYRQIGMWILILLHIDKLFDLYKPVGIICCKDEVK